MDKLKLEHSLAEKWIKNLGIFLIPVAVIYLTSVIGIIQVHNGAVYPSDFIPSQFTAGAITLYLSNGTIDYLKKLQG